jgi:hypothetical protein
LTAVTEEAATPGSAPAEGQLVTVRNRVWVVSDVARSTIAPQSMTGRPQHAVTLVSIEDDARDEQLRVVWELERGAVAHDQHVLPDPANGFDEPRQPSGTSNLATVVPEYSSGELDGTVAGRLA